MSIDLPVVYYAADLGEADIVVAWLTERGIRADVKDRHAAGTMEVRTIPSPAGIEVCVLDPAQADPARAMLLEHFTEPPGEPVNTEPATTECEECGTTSTFPPETRGRVEDCPRCGAYIDVPE